MRTARRSSSQGEPRGWNSPSRVFTFSNLVHWGPVRESDGCVPGGIQNSAETMPRQLAEPQHEKRSLQSRAAELRDGWMVVVQVRYAHMEVRKPRTEAEDGS